MFAMRGNRKIKNSLINPAVQLEISMHINLIPLIGAVVLTVVFLTGVTRMIIEYPPVAMAPEQAGELLANIQSAGTRFLAALGVLSLLSFVYSIKFLHRVAGPAYRFERHLTDLIEGSYGSRTILRKGDMFGNIADRLNQLSEKLEQSQSREQILAKDKDRAGP